MARDDSAQNFTKTQQDAIQHLANLTHLFHHRNKNQHRRSHWYRHFDTFRRNLNRLTSLVCQLRIVPSTNLEKARKKKTDLVDSENIRKQLLFWQDVAVPRWQHAFSQLAADGRFATLGLVLLAILAEICSIVGVTAKFDIIGQTEMQKALQAFGEEWPGSESDLPKTSTKAKNEEEDVGVAVSRGESIEPSAGREGRGNVAPRKVSPPQQGFAHNDSEDDVRARSVTPVPAKSKVSVNISPKKRPGPKSAADTSMRKRKSKKGGSSLDDLFAGLV